MYGTKPDQEPDNEFVRVRDEIESRCGTSISRYFRDILRLAFDEVIDGSRTQRWEIAQLENTEKTDLGKKVEILSFKTTVDEAHRILDDLDAAVRPLNSRRF